MTQPSDPHKIKTAQASTSDIEATIVLAATGRGSDEILSNGDEAQPDDSGFSNRFEIICEFASGGMGTITKARDLSFGRFVAVKTLNEIHRDKPDSVKAFIAECRLNAKLDHPSIVPIYALGRDKEGYWEAAMKLINGSSLNDFINTIRKNYDHKRVSQSQERHALISRLEYFLKICEVIEYCHSLKIVHGDLKPDNILMGQFGEVYVMDWGCAQPDGAKPEHLSGTPNYLPPEFLETKTVTTGIDIYALGMILFEISTLRRGNNHCPISNTDNCTCCDVNDSSSYRHYLPKLRLSPRLKAVILKAVSPDPKQRYATVTELAADVRHYIYDEEVSAAPDNPLQKLFRFIYHNRIKSFLIASVLLLLPVAGWLYTSFTAMEREQQKDLQMLQRLRLQSYTDLLSSAINRKLLQAQGQLLLFADNLTREIQIPPKRNQSFYSNDDYLTKETSPSGMEHSAYYAYPVNFFQMVRILPQSGGHPDQWPGAGQYSELCRKILAYDLASRDIRRSDHRTRVLNNDDNLIHRLQVNWADGTRYSFPGTYGDPDTLRYQLCFRDDAPGAEDHQIIWSTPYPGVLPETYRIRCQYPMLDKQRRHIGKARLELRLEKLLSPLLRANELDPVHELFFIFADGSIAQVTNKSLKLLPQTGKSEGGISSGRLHKLLAELKVNHMQQLITDIGGRSCFVSGNYLPLIDGYLIQLISVEAMKNHHHPDLNLE